MVRNGLVGISMLVRGFLFPAITLYFRPRSETGDHTVLTLRDRLTRDSVIYSHGEGFHSAYWSGHKLHEACMQHTIPVEHRWLTNGE